MSAHQFLLVEDAGTAPPAGIVPCLSQERGLVLQAELLRAYQSTGFQNKLGKLWVEVYELRSLNLLQLRSSLKALIRQAQARVLQSYSFQATDEGVKALASELERYPDGPDAPKLEKIVFEIMDKLHSLEVSTAFAKTSFGKMSCPCVKCRKQEKESMTTSLHLTREKAEALLSQMHQALTSQRFYQLCMVLPDAGDCLSIQLPSDCPTRFRSWLPTRTSQSVLAVYAEILARFEFDPGEEGVGQMWWSLRPFLGEPEIMAKATAVVQSLGMAGRRAWEKLQPYRGLVVRKRYSQPLFSTERFMAMQLDLLRKFSFPQFQVALNALHRGHHPCSAGFGKGLTDLLAPIYASVLPLYGFADNEEGLIAIILALGRIMREPNVQVLAASIDSLLYDAEPGVGHAKIDKIAGRLRLAMSHSEEDAASRAPEDESGDPDPEVWHEEPLGKQQVLALLREHLAAFSTLEFQRKVALLRSEAECWGGPGKETHGMMTARAQLALSAQQEILPKFGMEGSLRGAHALLQLCAPYIFDPEVARLTYAVHFLLGMDEPEGLVAKLRGIQGEVDLPSSW